MKIIQKRNPINVSAFNFNMDDDMQPGLYDIPIDSYHESDGLSNSGITKLLDCPYKYWYEYLNKDKPQEEKESRALLIGQALHTLSLEPEKYEEKFFVMPQLDRRTKAGKEQYAALQEEHKGKTLLTADEADQVKKMADSIRSNKAFMKLIEDKNKYIEHSIYFNDPETGVLLKSRPDFFNHFLVLDLKTTISAKPQDFEKAIFNYGYHRQAALALDALTSLTGCRYDSFVILAVEKEAPYLTALYVLDAAAIELGRKQYKEAVKTFKQCQTENKWEGYPEEVVQITLPNWAFNSQLN